MWVKQQQHTGQHSAVREVELANSFVKAIKLAHLDAACRVLIDGIVIGAIYPERCRGCFRAKTEIALRRRRDRLITIEIVRSGIATGHARLLVIYGRRNV